MSRYHLLLPLAAILFTAPPGAAEILGIPTHEGLEGASAPAPDGFDADATITQLGHLLADARMEAEVCRVARDDFQAVYDRVVAAAQTHVYDWSKPWYVHSSKQGKWPIPWQQQAQNITWDEVLIGEPGEPLDADQDRKVRVYLTVSADALRMTTQTGKRDHYNRPYYHHEYQRFTYREVVNIRVSAHEAMVLLNGRPAASD